MRIQSLASFPNLQQEKDVNLHDKENNQWFFKCNTYLKGLPVDVVQSYFIPSYLRECCFIVIPNGSFDYCVNC